jgi:hypothetical protein
MPVNGKAKGSAFERTVCQQLSLWISAGKQKDLLWRSAMSGGRATVAQKRGDRLSNQAGDISAVHPDGHKLTDRFCIECKFYADLDLGAFWFGKGKLAQFWKETRDEAQNHFKRPLLIAKQNRLPAIVLLDANKDSNIVVLNCVLATRRSSKLGVDRFALVKFDDLLSIKFSSVVL